MARTEQAVVLAGGQGTRLRPYTTQLPKPLVPVGDRPILDIVLRQLVAAGCGRITVTTGYLGGLIEAYFQTGADYGVQLEYFREHEPLGTVGALALIDGLDDDFLVVNGDVLTDLDYGKLLAAHRASDAALTIAACERAVQIPLGVLEAAEDDEDRIVDYVEKPTIPYRASMGVYCLAPRTLAFMEPGVRLDFPQLVLRLLAAGEPVRAYSSRAYWLDIGTLDDYEQALVDFQADPDRLLPPAPPAPPGQRVEPGS